MSFQHTDNGKDPAKKTAPIASTAQSEEKEEVDTVEAEEAAVVSYWEALLQKEVAQYQFDLEDNYLEMALQVKRKWIILLTR